jgi:diadenosine tetraphosphatase ApaH/serine/threonine PP2A family protein phosphatase
MLIAFLSDIHANLQALEACLAQAQRLGAERYVFLGDYVGYGGDPGAVVDRLMGLSEGGALLIRGNHDCPPADEVSRMNDAAAAAARWTATQLTAPQRAFLEGLPLALSEEDRLYVHADASAPPSWRYITGSADAARSLSATQARIVLCGHVHVPAVYAQTADGRTSAFRPPTGTFTPLLRQRRWQVVVGSVGQPRDRDPAAAFCLYDTLTAEIRFERAPYDVAAAQARIRAAGLPEGLAARLSAGR